MSTITNAPLPPHIFTLLPSPGASSSALPLTHTAAPIPRGDPQPQMIPRPPLEYAPKLHPMHNVWSPSPSGAMQNAATIKRPLNAAKFSTDIKDGDPTSGELGGGSHQERFLPPWGSEGLPSITHRDQSSHASPTPLFDPSQKFLIEAKAPLLLSHQRRAPRKHEFLTLDAIPHPPRADFQSKGRLHDPWQKELAGILKTAGIYDWNTLVQPSQARPLAPVRLAETATVDSFLQLNSSDEEGSDKDQRIVTVNELYQRYKKHYIDALTVSNKRLEAQQQRPTALAGCSHSNIETTRPAPPVIRRIPSRLKAERSLMDLSLAYTSYLRPPMPTPPDSPRLSRSDLPTTTELTDLIQDSGGTAPSSHPVVVLEASLSGQVTHPCHKGTQSPPTGDVSHLRSSSARPLCLPSASLQMPEATQSNLNLTSSCAKNRAQSGGPTDGNSRRKQIGIAPLGCEWSSMIGGSAASSPSATSPRERRRSSASDRTTTGRSSGSAKSRSPRESAEARGDHKGGGTRTPTSYNSISHPPKSRRSMATLRPRASSKSMQKHLSPSSTEIAVSAHELPQDPNGVMPVRTVEPATSYTVIYADRRSSPFIRGSSQRHVLREYPLPGPGHLVQDSANMPSSRARED